MSEFNKFADLMIEAVYQENIKNLGKPMAELMKQSVIQLKPVIEIFFNKGMEIGKAQAVPNTQALHDRLLVKSIKEHVESHIAEISVNDLFDKGWLAAMKCIQNNIDILEAQEPAND